MSHLAVIMVAAVVLLVSQAELPNWQFSLRDLPEGGLFTQPHEVPLVYESDNPLTSGEAHVADATNAFTRAVVPFTTQPEAAPAPGEVQAAPVGVSSPAQRPETNPSQSARRESIETYVVRPGDTVLGIAARFHLAPETIQWANPSLESNPDLLRVGDRLVILPVDGVLHVVRPGDTLSSIAAKYKVPMEAIASYPLNKMESINTPLSVGQQLVVPGGQKPYIPRQVVAYNGPVPQGASQGSGVFGWPTDGVLTQPFWSGHRALDIGAWTGTPILAADSGYVIAARTGWNFGYGNMVMIDHGNGYVTLYGHMNSIFVRQGENVAKGEQIGTVGNTGNSTGPHLHFEIRYQGVPRNPMPFLP